MDRDRAAHRDPRGRGRGGWPSRGGRGIGRRAGPRGRGDGASARPVGHAARRLRKPSTPSARAGSPRPPPTRVLVPAGRGRARRAGRSGTGRRDGDRQAHVGDGGSDRGGPGVRGRRPAAARGRGITARDTRRLGVAHPLRSGRFPGLVADGNPRNRPLRWGGATGVPRHRGRGRPASGGGQGAVAHRHRAHRRARAHGQPSRPARGSRDRRAQGRVADWRADRPPVELRDPRDGPRRPQPQVLRRRHGHGRA